MQKPRLALWVVYVIVFLLFANVVFVRPGRAQEVTAAIQGTITDSSGAVVANALVTATSPALIKPVTTHSDKAGYYRLNALPPGKYDVEVTASGLTAKATGISLTAGSLPTLNLKANVSSASETIEVSSAESLISVTESKVESTVTQEILAEIPKGRSFDSVIPFAPGARQEPLQSQNTNRIGGYQIDGASNSENVFSFDGLNITGIQNGGVGASVPMEFVQDVQIKSSSFNAEFGGALGGVVNVIPRRGSNQWHGSFLTYYRANFLDANDQCNFGQTATSYTTTCGLRYVPGTSSDSKNRIDAPAQYYIAKQDKYKVIDPGFTIGGPILKDKLWLFSSYIPDFASSKRTVNFTGTTPGPRTFTATNNTQFGLVRLDYAPVNSLRLYATWMYLFNRISGIGLPNPDSSVGQLNTTAANDPSIYRADNGSVNPQGIYTFAGDWTPTSHTLVSAKYGYWYSNSADRGKPSGVRYYFQTSSVNAKGLDGTPIPSTYEHNAAFANMDSNLATNYNVYTRKSLNIDVSNMVTGWYGVHNFKFGYANNNVANNVFTGYNKAYVQFYFGQDYDPGTGQSACANVIAENVAKYGQGVSQNCRGQWGYFVIRDGVDTIGNVSSMNHALYAQDSWQMGHTGLSIDAGVRLDKEYLPPYSAGSSSIGFGFTDKIAPRIGGAYDVLHNGKLKLYASYGQFFDIMKYSLPRGSFGGDYWHNCVYAMDNPDDYLRVNPTAPNNHACPATGPAPGVTTGRFIENLDLRANVVNAKDPGVDPNVKPMQQHEFVLGADWAARPRLAISARYARKRLDNTIEDIGVTDNLGFYIGNPGPGYGDLLHRVLYAQDYTSPLCSNCPAQPKAIRNYDGLEFRATYQQGHWFGTASYTYSSLTGNYPGLTSTYATDGGGGRQSPNNNRSFDAPQMQFTTLGKQVSGKLPTDRPHTVQIFGYYRLPWIAGESSLGFSQSIFSGTPISTCMPTLTSTSTCQFIGDQGTWAKLSIDASRNLISGGNVSDNRTPAYLQTNANIKHEFRLRSEGQKVAVELNVNNLFNQRAATSFYNLPTTNVVQFTGANNPTGYDFYKYMTGWDYLSETNKAARTYNNWYGKANSFQYARTLRVKIAYTF